MFIFFLDLIKKNIGNNILDGITDNKIECYLFYKT